MDYNIVNEIKLSYSRKGNAEKTVLSSFDVQEVFRAHFDGEQIDYKEFFFALYLDQKSKVLGIKKVSECGISSAVVDVRILMQGALLCNASSIIVCHNHPSGNLKPSSQDIAMTGKIKEAAKVLDFTLLDHIILTSESYLSFADEAMI